MLHACIRIGYLLIKWCIRNVYVAFPTTEISKSPIHKRGVEAERIVMCCHYRPLWAWWEKRWSRVKLRYLSSAHGWKEQWFVSVNTLCHATLAPVAPASHKTWDILNPATLSHTLFRLPGRRNWAAFILQILAYCRSQTCDTNQDVLSADQINTFGKTKSLTS